MKRASIGGGGGGGGGGKRGGERNATQEKEIYKQK